MSKEQKPYQIEKTDDLDTIIVSWIITHACQERCGYCISPNISQELTTKEEHFSVQDKLIAGGLTKNRYIGGEPLTIPHLPDLIADAHDKGVNTRLSTNGILLTEKKFREVAPSLDSIAFPFESLNDEDNEKIRGSRNHRQIIVSRIEMVKAEGNMGLLINTCVHRENIDHLEDLGGLLNELSIDHWKLRRFYSESGRGAVINKSRFDITDEEFYRKIESLQRMYPALKIDGRMPSKLASRLMVSPRGDLYRMFGEDENEGFTIYGNLLHDDLSIRDISIRDKCD